MAVDRPTLVIFGAGGQVGRALRDLAPPPGWRRRAVDRQQTDIGDATAIERALDGIEGGVVVNAAAYTAVDRAESDPTAATAINATAAGRVAAAAARRGLPIIHLSTDFVFDGRQPTPYVEGDAPNPRSVYGASKLAGEGTVAAANPRHLILRTAWVFSPHAPCFPRTIYRLLRDQDAVRVVEDQIGNPTPADALARTIVALAPTLAGADGDRGLGILHYAGAPALSRYAFACAIAEAARRGGWAVGKVVPCPTEAKDGVAERPAQAALCCDRITAIHGIAMPAWRDALPTCIARYEEER